MLDHCRIKINGCDWDTIQVIEENIIQKIKELEAQQADLQSSLLKKLQNKDFDVLDESIAIGCIYFGITLLNIILDDNKNFY